MMNIAYTDIVTQIIRNTKTFEGVYKVAWENCFQFSALDQIALFNKAALNLVALEMVGIWLSWYSGGNMRDDINEIHGYYKEENLDNVADAIELDVWELLSNKSRIKYSIYLDKTFGEPTRNMRRASIEECIEFALLATKFYTPNMNYDFYAQEGAMFRLPNDYELELSYY